MDKNAVGKDLCPVFDTCKFSDKCKRAEACVGIYEPRGTAPDKLIEELEKEIFKDHE